MSQHVAPHTAPKGTRRTSPIPLESAAVLCRRASTLRTRVCRLVFIPSVAAVFKFFSGVDSSVCCAPRYSYQDRWSVFWLCGLCVRLSDELFWRFALQTVIGCFDPIVFSHGLKFSSYEFDYMILGWPRVSVALRCLVPCQILSLCLCAWKPAVARSIMVA